MNLLPFEVSLRNMFHQIYQYIDTKRLFCHLLPPPDCGAGPLPFRRMDKRALTCVLATAALSLCAYERFLRLSCLKAGRFLLARPLIAVPTGEAALLQGAGKTFEQT